MLEIQVFSGWLLLRAVRDHQLHTPFPASEGLLAIWCPLLTDASIESLPTSLCILPTCLHTLLLPCLSVCAQTSPFKNPSHVGLELSLMPSF